MRRARRQARPERAVISGEGHNIPQAGIRFNDTLLAFIARAEGQAG
jgi:hypothetical protein